MDVKTKLFRPGRRAYKPDIKKARQLAARGLTQQQIADALGIHIDTLCKYKKLNAEFAEAIRLGAAEGIGHVANSLFVNATQHNNVAAQIFYLKARANWVETTRQEITGKDGKELPGGLLPQMTIVEIKQLLMANPGLRELPAPPVEVEAKDVVGSERKSPIE